MNTTGGIRAMCRDCRSILRNAMALGAISIGLALLLAACGGETPAVTVTVGQGDSSTSAAEDVAATEPTSTTDSPIEVVAGPRVVYMPNQTGGKYHVAFAVVKNTTDAPLAVQAQFSIEDAKGLVGTADANATLLAGQEGVLLADAIDLPRAFKNGDVGLATSVSDAWISSDALTDPGAISLSKVRLKPPAEWSNCEFTATVTNNTPEKQSVQISWVGFKNGEPVNAGYTFPDLFPGTPKVATAEMYSDALCPKGVDEVRGYWEPAF